MNDEGKSHQKSFRKKVEFNPQVYTILVSPASEYRDWGIWHDVWYDEEDYAAFFEYATRKVRFDTEVKVVLVATRGDFFDWGLTSQLWYGEDDYRRFHEERRRHVDSIRARKLMEFTDGIHSPVNMPHAESKLNEDGKFSDEIGEMSSFDNSTYQHADISDSDNLQVSFRHRSSFVKDSYNLFLAAFKQSTVNDDADEKQQESFNSISNIPAYKEASDDHDEDKADESSTNMMRRRK